MLTAVKNQFKVTLLAIKYALMKEMINKTTFLANVIFMVINNGSMIIQWVVLYSLKDSIGGYSFQELMLLWGLAAATYGISHLVFPSVYRLSDTIINGKLDAFLVQPKSVLLNVATTHAESSAIGDILFGFGMIFLYGFSFKTLLLFTIFAISGGLILTAFAIILGSLSFWLKNSDVIADNGNNLMVHFATYPDGIFKGLVKVLLFTLVPVGISTYIPIKVIVSFNLFQFFVVILFTTFIVSFASLIFNKGLKRYSSSNLMNARI